MMKNKMPAGIVVVLALMGIGAAFALTLTPGDVVNVSGCTTRLRVVNATQVACITNTPSRTPTRTPTATRTATPTRTHTNTATPTATPSATATEHAHQATATAVVTATVVPPTPSGGLAPVDPTVLGTCAAEVHDRYVTVGPDGRTYRTWHPQAVPVDINDPQSPKCRFAHEHGDDPATSTIFREMPAFGYVAYVGQHPEEPHPGFKVAVGNKGEVNDEGRVMLVDSLVVFHMGTGSPNRYSQRHHSAIIAVRLAGGQVARVQGLFDTFGVGSICERDVRNNDGDFSNDIGRTVMTLPGTGCEVTSAYEIWGGAFDVRNPAGALVYRAFVTMAVFDPILTMNPANIPELIYTTDAFYARRNEAPFMGEFHSCDRENYHSAGNWYNTQNVTVYYTDAFGKPLAQGAAGALRQEVARFSGETIGISQRSDGVLNQFKQRDDYCAVGLGLKN